MIAVIITCYDLRELSCCHQLKVVGNSFANLQPRIISASHPPEVEELCCGHLIRCEQSILTELMRHM